MVVAQHRIGDAEVRVFSSQQVGWMVFSVLDRGRVVFSIDDDSGGSVQVGPEWNDPSLGYTDEAVMRARSLPKSEQVASGDPAQLLRIKAAARWLVPGADVTGDGLPDLVVWLRTPGAHCCLDLFLFGLTPAARLIDRVRLGAAWSGDARLVDLDRDGYPEIEVFDSGFEYWNASYSESPTPRVVLKLKDGKFRVWPPLMIKESPAQEELVERAKQVGFQSFGPSPHLWREVLDLAYTGHARLARKFIDLAWPANVPGKLAWLRSFRKQLESCQYWQEVKKIDGGI